MFIVEKSGSSFRKVASCGLQVAGWRLHVKDIRWLHQGRGVLPLNHWPSLPPCQK